MVGNDGNVKEEKNDKKIKIRSRMGEKVETQ